MMMSDLTKFFHNAHNNNVKLRFWFEDNINDDARLMYVKDIFANSKGDLEGLVLGTDKDKNHKWEHFRWNDIVKFGYADIDQDVSDKKLPEEE